MMLEEKTPDTAQEFQKITDISQEMADDYQKWYQLLRHWNKKINLVSPQTLNQFWSRHALDSHQLLDVIPEGANCMDMGSGGGFPAIAIAIAQKHYGKASGKIAAMSMVETNGKKCNFLRAVIRELELGATIKQMRVEDLKDQLEQYPDIITARAFAPLDILLHHIHPLWQTNTKAIFPKGRSWQAEIETAKTKWEFDYTLTDSKTDPDAKIITIHTLHETDT